MGHTQGSPGTHPAPAGGISISLDPTDSPQHQGQPQPAWQGRVHTWVVQGGESLALRLLCTCPVCLTLILRSNTHLTSGEQVFIRGFVDESMQKGFLVINSAITVRECFQTKL